MQTIARLSEAITLEVEDDEGLATKRSFVVREHSLQRSARFLHLLDQAVKQEGQTYQLATEDQEQHLWERVAECIEPVLRLVLSHPQDEAEVSDQFLRNLTLSQREAILNAQIRVNRVDDIAPKVMAILVQIHSVRMARTIMDLDSFGGKFATESLPATDSPPCVSGAPGPDDKPSGFGDLPTESDGTTSSGSAS